MKKRVFWLALALVAFTALWLLLDNGVGSGEPEGSPSAGDGSMPKSQMTGLTRLTNPRNSKTGRFRSSPVLLEQFLETYGRTPENLVAAASFSKREPGAAYISEALAIDPGNPVAALYAHSSDGIEYDLAAGAELLIAKNPTDALGYIFKALASYKSGDEASALAAVKKIIDEDILLSDHTNTIAMARFTYAHEVEVKSKRRALEISLRSGGLVSTALVNKELLDQLFDSGRRARESGDIGIADRLFANGLGLSVSSRHSFTFSETLLSALEERIFVEGISESGANEFLNMSREDYQQAVLEEIEDVKQKSRQFESWAADDLSEAEFEEYADLLLRHGEQEAFIFLESRMAGRATTDR